MPRCIAFEAIHPFTDGNGRTGRVLNRLFLVEEELRTLRIPDLSRYIAAGVLREVAVGRDKLFLHPRLLDLLTHHANDFAPFPT